MFASMSLQEAIMNAVQRAYELARSGNYENFSQIKHALRREFYVERDLVGRELAADLGRVCKKAWASRSSNGGSAASQTAADAEESRQVTRLAVADRS